MENIQEWFTSLPIYEQEVLLEEVLAGLESNWPEEYTNSSTGKVYSPHNKDEAEFVSDDEPRFWYLKGGEGSGKSVAGIIKTLDKLRRGVSGIMVSPDLEHFKKSLWPEFVKWCPVEPLLPKFKGRISPSWEPVSTFTLLFHNEVGGISRLICGGIKESESGSWEGPNVNFAYFDEARRHKTANALKVLVGRIRIEQHGIPPQLYITSTPRKHWLFKYFGPMKKNDPHKSFKDRSRTTTLTLEENIDNLDPDYIDARSSVLTGSEVSVAVNAEWIDEDAADKFIQIVWWDKCQEVLPPLTDKEPMIVAIDGAKGGKTTDADMFVIVGITRHPTDNTRAAIRYNKHWKARSGETLDYDPIEEEIKRLGESFNVIEFAYDVYQFHRSATDLMYSGVGYFREFSQGKERAVADKQLEQFIIRRRIAHNGDEVIREHIDNAYKTTDGNDHMRIIKHNQGEKIDYCVVISMGLYRIMFYNE